MLKLTILLIALIPLQELPEYGEASELRGKQRVYVTADSMDSRKLILSVLKGYKGLTVVNTPEESEFILEYSTKASTESLGRRSSHYVRSEMVAYTLSDKRRKRMLWSEDETLEQRGSMVLSRPNEVNLAKNFVKMHKKLHGVK